MTKLPLDLTALAKLCHGQVIGDGERLITTLCAITTPKADGLTFVASAAAAKSIGSDDSISYIVKPEWQGRIKHGISHDNPQQAFRLILQALTDKPKPPHIATSAVISRSARLAEDVSIGANCVIGDNVHLGRGCQLGANVVIEESCNIGAGTRIGHQATLHHHTDIGNNCVISEGAVIGGQGFGFSFEGGVWQAIPQIGRVIIGNGVHIGANTCIDRGAIDDTLIGNNVIIDNLVHIAHNVKVGDGTAMAAGVGIAGSTRIGKHCLLGGQVGVVGHIRIADGVQINGGARVLQNLNEPGAYAGSFNVMPAGKWNRAAAYFKRLEHLFKREKSQ